MTTPTNLLTTLASYTPVLVRRHLIAHPDPLTEPVDDHFTAAVLLADISGFTALTEQLAAEGPGGAEKLTQLLNAYFGRLIDTITHYGGDIVKFAGDALLAIWPNPDLPTATLQAARCALDIHQQLNRWQTPEGHALSLHSGIGAGDLTTAHLGGMYGRWEFLLIGQPLAEVGLAGSDAQAGQTVITASAWKLIEPHCQGNPLPSGSVHLTAAQPDAASPSPLASHLPTEAAAALRTYIPAAIRRKLIAGQTDWLAELRHITVLFINLPQFSHDIPLDQMQAVMLGLQKMLYRYEGSINKLNVDDKGITLVAALGLPPLAHEDDPTRGVLAALDMQAALRALDTHGSIGITTGQVFCGVVGNDNRREYTMMGDVVNLAARLMQAAQGGILCDAPTWQASHDKIDYRDPTTITVKGKPDPITVYQPQRAHHKISRRAPQTAIVGRQRERTELTEHVQRLLFKHQNATIIIEGEAGLGKSRLVEELIHEARTLGISTLIGAGDAIEQSAAYHAWTPVFSDLFNLDLFAETATQAGDRSQRVLDYLQTKLPDMAHLAPLLSTILPIDIPDTPLTVEMSGETRADNLKALLLELLKSTADEAPYLLVLEDAHWLDSASWALAQQVRRNIRSLLLIVATRPIPPPVPQEYLDLYNTPDTYHMKLDRLSRPAIESLICQRLGVARLSLPVANLIHSRAEGHPFYSEELAYALRDSEYIAVVNGECRFAPKVDLDTIMLPDTLQGIIISRFDRLTAQQQITVKAASVIGRIFSYYLLHDIHPIEADRPHLNTYLDELEQLDITPLETPEPDLAYIFKHITTQRVAYNLMPFAQRRELHHAIAQWHEKKYEDELAHFYPLLAHHWQQAGDIPTAINYIEKAGRQAIHNFANEEAAEFFHQALALSEQPEAADITPIRKSKWHAFLARAYVDLGKIRVGYTHAIQGLELLGYEYPTTTTKLLTGIIRQTIRQTLHRLRPSHYLKAPVTKAERDALMIQARIYNRLGYIYFLGNEAAHTLYTSLRILNASEKAGPSTELAYAYAVMCLTAGVMGIYPLAEKYYELTSDMVEQLRQYASAAFVYVPASIYKIGVGQWEPVQEKLEATIPQAKRLGTYRYQAESMVILALSEILRGNVQYGRNLYQQVLNVGRRSQNSLHQIWGLDGLAIVALYQGQFEYMYSLVKEAESLITDNVDRATKINTYGHLALSCTHLQQWTQARKAADTTLDLIGQASPTVYSIYLGYYGAAETYLTLWQHARENPGGEAGDPVELQRLARQTCQHLHKYRRRFPIGRPGAWLYQGLYHQIEGKTAKATKAWQKSLAAAEELRMPFEQAHAQYQLGRQMPPNNPQRITYLQQAATTFAQLKAKHYQKLAQQELK